MASDPTLFPISAPGSYFAFRYSSYDVPFWARPNTRDGRWQRAGEEPTQYWAMCAEAGWAELIRAENLTTEDELDLVRMNLWVTRVPKTGLIDLRDPGRLSHYGLTDDDITGDSWTRCQAAAPALRRDGRGILTSSAALPGHANLTIFGARRMIDWHSEPALSSTLPASLAAIGRPPPGLLQHVRRPGPAQPQPSRLFDT